MSHMVLSTVGKDTRLKDRISGYCAKGKVIKDVVVVQDKRFTKFLQIIEWNEPPEEKGKREIRFCYYDGPDFKRAPLLLPPDICEELLNNAVDEGILQIDKSSLKIKIADTYK